MFICSDPRVQGHRKREMLFTEHRQSSSYRYIVVPTHVEGKQLFDIDLTLLMFKPWSELITTKGNNAHYDFTCLVAETT